MTDDTRLMDYLRGFYDGIANERQKDRPMHGGPSHSVTESRPKLYAVDAPTAEIYNLEEFRPVLENETTAS